MKPSIEKVLLQIALDLSSNLSSDLHYQRLISSIHQVFPCDASALFVLDHDGCLKPVAVQGLSTAVLGRCFPPKVPPRLQAILESNTLFDSNPTQTYQTPLMAYYWLMNMSILKCMTA